MRPTWWPRARHHHGRDRGFVEAGIAAGGALLVVGAVVGNGVAATVVDMSDGHTWLPGENGRIVQVNPATGQPERRLVVAGEESDLSISQRDGNLIVTDLATGDLTAVDLTALVASGSRAGSSDDLVLVGGGQVVLVDTDPGTVRAVDPLTLADLGRPYRTGAIADAVIDDEGAVWVLTADGDLTELTYDAAAAQFHTGTERPVAGAGPQSRLVPHEKGVTVFAADDGAVVQVGAGSDLAVTVPDLTGSVAAAPRSPADLVPAAAEERGVLFLLADRDLLQVDVGALGCAQPGQPVVFNQKVYLPCTGIGRIMVLDAAGQRAGADIVVPGGGDPQLTMDEGRLFITSQQDGRAVVVQEDGSTAVVDLSGAEVPEQAVDRQPTVNVPPPGAPPAAQVNVPPVTAPPVSAPPVSTPPATTPQTDPRDRQPQGTAPDPADPADRGDRSDRPGTQRPGDGASVPPGAQDPDESGSDALPDAADGSDGSADDPTGAADATGSPDATGGADGSADSTGDATGAEDGSADADDAADDSTGDAEQPQNVAATLTGEDSVRVTWAAPSRSPQQYVVASSDGVTPQTVAGTATSATLTGLTCGRSLTMTVTAHHPGGQSASASTSVTTADCSADPADPADLRPTGVQANPDGDDTVQVRWSTPAITPSQMVVSASPGGASRTVAGTATSATLTGLSCGQDYTITVTAEHTGESDGAASTAVTMADCPVDPADLRPTGVHADGNTDGEAQVTWTTPAITPDRVVVSASPGGASQAVAGSATSATLPGLSCGQNYTITVTAEHTGESDGSASTTVTMPDCPAAPEATAATNVRATASGSTVTVSWNRASSGADEYQVRPVGGSWTSAGTDTSLPFEGLAVGSYTFQVRTVLGSSQADATSNEVTVAGAPGAPGTPSVSIVSSDRSQVTFQASWTAAAANGSSITGYAVSWSGGGVSGSTTVSGTSTGSIPISCSGQSLCTNGGTLTVTVAATNGVGTGPAASGSGTVPTPPPPPPADGDPVLSESHRVDDQTGDITATITYNPISTWANFAGTCTATVNGESRVISCSSPTTIWSGGDHITRGLYVSASVTASGGGVNATSSTSVTVPGRGWCDPNSGICYDPVSLDPSDPDVEITPAPWTPPEVPNPPVLVAGAFLLGTAGLLRTTRRTLAVGEQGASTSSASLEPFTSVPTEPFTAVATNPLTTLTLGGHDSAGQNGDQPR